MICVHMLQQCVKALFSHAQVVETGTECLSGGYIDVTDTVSSSEASTGTDVSAIAKTITTFTFRFG